MQSSRSCEDLSTVYYVEVEATGVLPVPAERIREVGRVRAEYQNRWAAARQMFAGCRIA
jgi:hypothetical protein